MPTLFSRHQHYAPSLAIELLFERDLVDTDYTTLAAPFARLLKHETVWPATARHALFGPRHLSIVLGPRRDPRPNTLPAAVAGEARQWLEATHAVVPVVEVPPPPVPPPPPLVVPVPP